MKTFLLLFLFTCCGLSAQMQPLTFDSRLLDCEDRYILLEKDTSSSHSCMFVYLDRTAGFTMQFVINVDLSASGVASVATGPLDSLNGVVKIRIQGGMARNVALLPDAVVDQLGLPREPEWLAIYRYDDATADAAARGFAYNAKGLSAKALSILQPLYTETVKDSLFLFEFVFALNALGRKDSALLISERAVALFPEALNHLKEYAFALMQSGQLDDAVELYKRGIDLCDDSYRQKEIATEFCVNIASIRRYQGDIPSFKKWIDRAKETVPPNSPLKDRLKSL